MTAHPIRRALAAGASAATLLALPLVTPAEALAPENAFSADAQSTWQTNGAVWAVAAARGKVFAGGTFTSVRAPGTAAGDASSMTRNNFVVLDAATGVPTSCTVSVTLATSTPTVRAVAASPDGSTIYFGGSFSTVNGVSRSNVAAIDATTCTLLPFNPGANGFVHAITATASKVYLGGSFTTFGGQTRSRLAAVTPTGSLLPWVPTAEDAILALGVDPGTGNVVLGGRMDLVNGVDSHDLAVVDGNTGTTTVKAYPAPFFPYTPGQGQRSGNTAIKAIATDATGFYIGAEGTGGGVFDGRAAFNWSDYGQRWRDNCLGATQAMVVHRGVLFNADHAHNCEAEGTFEDGVRHYLNAQGTQNKKFTPWWPNTNAGTGEGIGPRAVTVAQVGTAHYLWYGGEFTTRQRCSAAGPDPVRRGQGHGGSEHPADAEPDQHDQRPGAGDDPHHPGHRRREPHLHGLPGDQHHPRRHPHGGLELLRPPAARLHRRGPRARLVPELQGQGLGRHEHQRLLGHPDDHGGRHGQRLRPPGGHRRRLDLLPDGGGQRHRSGQQRVRASWPAPTSTPRPAPGSRAGSSSTPAPRRCSTAPAASCGPTPARSPRRPTPSSCGSRPPPRPADA